MKQLKLLVPKMNEGYTIAQGTRVFIDGQEIKDLLGVQISVDAEAGFVVAHLKMAVSLEVEHIENPQWFWQKDADGNVQGQVVSGQAN